MARATQGIYVFLHGEQVGVAARSRRGAVHFSYSADRRASAAALSLSVPVGQRDSFEISSWIDGLLPDSQRTRSRWARELGAASTDPFDLLCARAGLECAGAVQFYREPVLPDSHLASLVPFTDSEVAEILRLIAQDAEDAPSQGLGELRLSLPGAQPKMALRLTGDGWCLPTGSLATTHILKPQRGHLNAALRGSIAVNEHLCQTAAATLGLDAAPTKLEAFEDETCLVVERFDRHEGKDEVRRLHFEDMCQALGLAPDRKYQSDGGPTPEDIIELLRHETGHADRSKFFLSVFYNWLIGNTDGHSKNYGVLLDGPRPRLAPLYDLSSSAPYVDPEDEPRPAAMRFAEPGPATLQDWSRTAARLGIDVTTDALVDMAQALPEAFETAEAQCPRWASATACMVRERVVAHADRVARGADGSRTGPSRSVAAEPVDVETCGETVKRTGKPCLLRPDHNGRHRSVP